MARKVRLNLRKLLRRLGREAQDKVIERLLASRSVRGVTVEPLSENTNLKRKNNQSRTTGRATFPGQSRGTRVGRASRPRGSIRTRFQGVRFSLPTAEKPGVRTGQMLRAMSKRRNVKVTRSKFTINVPGDVRVAWFGFNVGRKGKQVKRPVSGITAEDLRRFRDQIAEEMRVQLVNQVGANLARARRRRGRRRRR